MEIRVLNIELRHFSDRDNGVLADILSRFVESVNGYIAAVDIKQTAADLQEIFDKHRIEHGISIGCLYEDNGAALGIGGFHYLEETGVYEMVCAMLPEHEGITAYALEFLEHQAFANLRMDKVCARALPGTVLDVCLRNNGFVYSGERAFIPEGADQIWNYYELENEGNMVSATSGTGLIYSDWDAIF